MVKAVGPPELPVATVKPGEEAPLLLVSLVTAEVATGFMVSQLKFMVQELALEEIIQEPAAGVRVPDIAAADTTTCISSVSVAPSSSVTVKRKM